MNGTVRDADALSRAAAEAVQQKQAAGTATEFHDLARRMEIAGGEAWKAVRRDLLELREQSARVCQGGTDVVELYRAQGRIQALSVLLALYDEAKDTLMRRRQQEGVQ
jgi:hypothetical protein